MKRVSPRGTLFRAFGRGYFPHQFSWLIDNPLRRLLVRPERFADRLSLTSGSRILELGPGSGYFSSELARRVPNGHLELVDLQAEMLVKAKRKLKAVGISNVSYTVANLNHALPFRDGSFDVVVMVAVLGEIHDAAGALRSCHQVLRSGGILAIHEHFPDPDLIKPEALRPMMESARFRLCGRWGPSWNYTALFERNEEHL